MIKPVFVAEKLCDEHGYNFWDCLSEYLEHGWVYSGEDCFVMAKTGKLSELIEQNLNKDVDKECWFVFVYAGSLERVLELIPFGRELVVFRRNDGADKVYNMSALIKKIKRRR